MIAILDRQHLGKPSKPGDHGAVHGALRETDLTDAYIAAAADALRRHGHTVEVLVEGEYGTRHHRAREIARGAPKTRCAYVACHVNAGGGTYGLVEYDARSTRGAQLADELAHGLRALPGVTTSRTKGLGAGERGWVCIDGIYAGPANLAGVIFEPGFIDAGGHAGLWTAEGLTRIGTALALACEGWAA